MRAAPEALQGQDIGMRVAAAFEDAAVLEEGAWIKTIKL